MFVVEIVAGLIAGSNALQADALDFLGDAGNYGISLFVLGMGLRARANAALIKGATMAAFGSWVVASTLWHVWHGGLPRAEIMGGIGLLALVANAGIAAILFAHRHGDANRRSVWICSRNDAIANLAVLAAAAGVAGSGTRWPDLAVAALIAGLNLSGAMTIIRQARRERRTV